MKNKMDRIKMDIELPAHRAMLKAALIKDAGVRLKKPAFIWKLAPALTLAVAVAAVGVYMRVDYNNNDGKVNDLGGVWCTYDDHYQGGTSTVWPPASTTGENSFVKSSPGSEGKGYAIRITGTAGTKLGYDFIGVNTFLSPRSTCPECIGINLSKFSGIRFKIKGSVEAGQVIFVFPHEAHVADKSRGLCRSLTSYNDYEADITKYITPSWKDVRLDFRKDLRQPSWTKVNERVNIEDVLSDANIIKWTYRGGRGHRVDIWIDKLEFY
jgi:hypothetical protein